MGQSQDNSRTQVRVGLSRERDGRGSFLAQFPTAVRLARLLSERSPRWPSVMVFGAVLSAILLARILLRSTDTLGNDDAAILWRYSLNFRNGLGLVYNPGEYVEGYSSFLYTVILAAGLFFVAPDRIFHLTVVINIACWVLLILLTYKLMRREIGAGYASCAALLLGLNPSLGAWATSGMETIPALLPPVLIWIQVVRIEGASTRAERKWHVALLTVAMVLSLLMRAEGFLWPGLALAYLVVKRHWKEAVVAAVMFCFVGGAYIAWRLWYYGYPLPNTYYAKVTGTLVQRLGSAWQLSDLVFWFTGLALPLFCLAIGLADTLQRILRERSLSAVSFEIVASSAWIAYWFYVGGDIYYERFLTILFPFGLYVGARYAAQCEIKSVPAKAIAMMTACFVVVSPLYVRYLPANSVSTGDSWAALGKVLGREFRGSTLATEAAGKLAYYSGLDTIDMLGLTDEHIGHGMEGPEFRLAHSKSDLAYVINREPNLLAVWVYSLGDRLFSCAKELEYFRASGYKPVYLANPFRWQLIEAGDLDESSMVHKVRDEGFSFIILYCEDPKAMRASNMTAPANAIP